MARAQRCMSEQLVLLSALCALEAVPLRFNYFATFWNEVAATPVSAGYSNVWSPMNEALASQIPVSVAENGLDR